MPTTANPLSRDADSARSVASASNTRLNALDWVAVVLTIIGGINWGLVGLFEFDLVARILGPLSPGSRVVYALVGLAALYEIFLATRLSRRSSNTI